MSFVTLAQSIYWKFSGYPASNCRRVLESSQKWSKQELDSFRNEKMRKLIDHCYKNVPYYQRIMADRRLTPKDFKSVEDLCKLPILTKDTLRACAQELQAHNASRMKVSLAITGGTTGEPIRVCRDWNCQAWGSMCFERGLKWGGREANESRIMLFGGSLGISKQRLTMRIGSYFRGDLFLPAFELRESNVLHYAERIRKSGSQFLVGYSSAIYRLATLLIQQGQKVKLKAVFPTAELFLPEWAQATGDAFDCPILPFYGCGEVNSLGYSTPKQSGYLVPDEHAVIEVMTNDSSYFYGDGRFLITDLDNYAMPIIRYLNGDAGKVSPPDGGYPFNRIERLDGRFNSLLMTDSGDLISGVIGTHVFRHTVSVKRYQIVQEEPLRVVIKIVPEVEITEGDRELILEQFSRHLGSKMKITIQIVHDLPVPPSGKSIFVINHCLNTTAYPGSVTDPFKQRAEVESLGEVV